MNLKALFAATCIAAAGTYAFAEDSHHPDQPKASEAPAKPVPKAPAGMGPMHEHMKMMREQMAAIRSATDPKERERLIDEHIKSMQEGMSMMQGMMMGGMMKNGGTEAPRRLNDSGESR
jgi:hypothetical protein